MSETKVTGLRSAINHVDELAGEAGVHSQKALTAYQELTGHSPNQPMDALNVYRIVCDVLEKHQLIGTME